MNPGKRTVSIAILALPGVLAAMQAGHVLEDRTEAMYVAPDFAADTLYASRCGEPQRVDVVDTAGGGRRVEFGWRPETSELTFDAGAANAGITLPERFVTAASLASASSCE